MITVLYYLHVGCVVVTSTGFVLRRVLSFRDSGLLRSPMAQILPHLVDTVLLLGALGMVWIYALNPITTPWLLAKILALLAYILFGYLALKSRYPFRLRLFSGVLALGLLGYIVSVAITVNAVPWRG